MRLAKAAAIVQCWCMQRMESTLEIQLRQEILLARERVYRFGKPTPIERLDLPGAGPEIWVKREDLSAV
jgi:threonine dehydratase